MGLKIGDKLPDFALKDQNGNMFRSVDHLGKNPLVIYFYPKDYTPGCTKQACDFRDRYEDFVELGAEVIGISADSEKMHLKFMGTYKLPFVLLADINKKVRKIFEVKNRLLNILPGRATFVFDQEGSLFFVYNGISASQHIKKALQALKTM